MEGMEAEWSRRQRRTRAPVVGVRKNGPWGRGQGGDRAGRRRGQGLRLGGGWVSGGEVTGGRVAIGLPPPPAP